MIGWSFAILTGFLQFRLVLFVELCIFTCIQYIYFVNSVVRLTGIKLLRRRRLDEPRKRHRLIIIFWTVVFHYVFQRFKIICIVDVINTVVASTLIFDLLGRVLVLMIGLGLLVLLSRLIYLPVVLVLHIVLQVLFLCLQFVGKLHYFSLRNGFDVG